ncbi:hypothetical protein PCE1_000361 [Barthelona sp. PCE]
MILLGQVLAYPSDYDSNSYYGDYELQSNDVAARLCEDVMYPIPGCLFEYSAPSIKATLSLRAFKSSFKKSGWSLFGLIGHSKGSGSSTYSPLDFDFGYVEEGSVCVRGLFCSSSGDVICPQKSVVDELLGLLAAAKDIEKAVLDEVSWTKFKLR